VKDYEVGLKSDFFDRRVRANLAAYYTKYDDIQRVVLVASTLNPSSTVVRNAAKATIKGAEAEVTVLPIDHLTLKVTGGLTDPKYKDYRDGLNNDLSGQPFVFIPKKTYSVSANYALPTDWGQVSGQVDWSYKGRVYYVADSQYGGGANGLPNFEYQSGFGLLNGRLSAKFDDAQLEVALFAKNITNKQYIAFSLDTTNTALGFVTYVPGERRTWGIEVTKTFP
jgi:iron complex outermembrane receptor protein